MKKKILLIDDDEDLLRSFQVILESNGYEVITAIDGKTGYSVLKDQNPDLLVLDVMMRSNLEGYNLLHTIKSDHEYKEKPIILLTGMLDQLGVNLNPGVEDESMFPNVRFQDKPVDPNVLIQMIRDMLTE
jgi:two-component system, OmpR family, alkaline phosphatase synthesis response regulator PhoP